MEPVIKALSDRIDALERKEEETLLIITNIASMIEVFMADLNQMNETYQTILKSTKKETKEG